MLLNKQISVKFTSPGFHRWPEASGKREYLKERHRHLFYYEVRMQVNHGDRDVEFHDLMDEAKQIVCEEEHGDKSCEQIAYQIIDKLKEKYADRQISVSVFEDNEAGAIVTTD